jgi:hypothetical protein
VEDLLDSAYAHHRMPIAQNQIKGYVAINIGLSKREA